MGVWKQGVFLILSAMSIVVSSQDDSSHEDSHEDLEDSVEISPKSRNLWIGLGVSLFCLVLLIVAFIIVIIRCLRFKKARKDVLTHGIHVYDNVEIDNQSEETKVDLYPQFTDLTNTNTASPVQDEVEYAEVKKAPKRLDRDDILVTENDLYSR